MADPNDSIAYLRSLVERMPENKDLPKPQFFMDPRAMSMANILKGGAGTTLDWLASVRGTGNESKPGEGYAFAATGLEPSDTLAPLGLAPMGGLVGRAGRATAPHDPFGFHQTIVDRAKAGKPLDANDLDDLRTAGERPVSAAVRLPNGKVYTGAIHSDAVEAAMRAGEDIDFDRFLAMPNSMEADGFVTNTGRYVTRHEGTDLIKRSDASVPMTAGILDAKNIPETVASKRKILLADNARANLPGTVLNSLPMDEASRMNRAREMGFDTPAWRGMSSDVSEMRPGSFFASSPNVADEFARSTETVMIDGKPHMRRSREGTAVYPVLLNTRGFADVDWPHWTHERDPQSVLDQYAGHPGAVFRGVREQSSAGVPHDQYVVFDPSRVRSTSADFDPAHSDKAGLLLSDQSRASVPGTVVNAQEERTPTLAEILMRGGY